VYLFAIEATAPTLLLGLGAALAGIGSILSGIAALRTANQPKEVKSETPK
jgi:hypothetical protein